MKELSARESYDFLKSGNTILIDVREQDEYDQVRIEDSILVPLSNLTAEIQKINFDATKDQKIIFHCLKGGRSAQAIEYLEDNILKGHDVYNMQGGILDWIEEDLPVKS